MRRAGHELAAVLLRDYRVVVPLGCLRFRRYGSGVPLFLIRHAVAGVRDNGDPSDDRRPLDALGLDQARVIADSWTEPIEAIFSSPALRCMQTVEPLAARLGLTVATAPELFEGASSSRSIAYVRSFTGRSVVLCSHGDVIPDILRNLRAGGTVLDGRGCAKASIWRLDNSTERIESGTYHVLSRSPTATETVGPEAAAG